MKKIILSFVCTLALLVTMQSCQKEVQLTEKVSTKEIAIDTTISSGSSYALNLASFGDEGDVATIVQQATHCSLSRIENETDMFTSIYHYIPSEKITGKDEVPPLAAALQKRAENRNSQSGGAHSRPSCGADRRPRRLP